jgi:ADP-glucose pyrophosphorylase
VIRGATVTNSVLAGNVHVAEGTLLDEAVVLPGARIGANCRLWRVIVDAGVEIPAGVSVGWQMAPPAESMRSAARVTLLSQSWTPPSDDTMRSVA